MLKNKQKPNILLITIDSLRADFCGWLNSKAKDLTPFLNELASQSIVFTDAFASGPSTPFSFPGILTGTYPFSFAGWDGKEFPGLNQRPNLAEILNKNGYYTIAIHSNPYLSEYYGYNKGFDEFYDMGKASLNKIERTFWSLNENNPLYKKVKNFLKNKCKKLFNLLLYFSVVTIRFDVENCPDKKAEDIHAKAKHLILNKPKEKPYFLWLHYMETHHPFVPPKQFYSKHTSIKKVESYNKLFYKLFYRNNVKIREEELEGIKELYRDTIRWLDGLLREFFDFLNKKQYLENTIVVVCADHGEEFMEKGNTGHKEKLISELLRVPLLIAGGTPDIPSILLAIKTDGRQEKINKKVSLTQIPATLFELSEIASNPLMEPSLFDKRKTEVKSEMITDYDSILNNFNLYTYQKIIH